MCVVCCVLRVGCWLLVVVVPCVLSLGYCFLFGDVCWCLMFVVCLFVCLLFVVCCVLCAVCCVSFVVVC